MLDKLFEDHDPADPVYANYLAWVQAADKEVLHPPADTPDTDVDVSDKMLHTLIPTHA
jgi:hypothetical protein